MAISTNIEGNYFVLRNTVGDTEIVRHPKNKLNFRADNDSYFTFESTEAPFDIIFEGLRFADLIDGRTGLAFADFATASTYLSSVLGSYELDGTIYTEVSISSAQIKAMGTTPIELLPAPGAGSYLEIDKCILEYTAGATAYVFGIASNFGVRLGGSTVGSEYGVGTLGNTSDNIMIFSTSHSPSTYLENRSLVITNEDSDDPTLGDGTILAKIWYKVRTLGSEL